MHTCIIVFNSSERNSIPQYCTGWWRDNDVKIPWCVIRNATISQHHRSRFRGE